MDSDGLSAFRPDVPGSDTAVDLLFQLTASDPAFFHYTDIDMADRDSTLWFDSTTAPAADGDAARRLHTGATASAADRVAWATLPLQHATAQRAPPGHVGFVRIRCSSAEPPTAPWLVAFDARAVVWKYLVMRASGRAFFIRDPDGQVEFEPASPAQVPGTTDTVTLRSTTAIAFRNVSPRRFQLMEATPHGERLLTKCLPVASPSALATETVNGRDLTVAEIVVYP